MLKTAISTKQNPSRKFVIPDNTTYSTVQKINNNVSTGMSAQMDIIKIKYGLKRFIFGDKSKAESVK